MPTGQHNLTDAEKAYFLEGYQQGITIKALAAQIGCHQHTLDNLRRRTGLTRRRRSDDKSKSIKVYVPGSLYEHARRRAREKRASLSQYVVGLIRRDVGFNPPEIQPRKLPRKLIRAEDIVSSMEQEFGK